MNLKMTGVRLPEDLARALKMLAAQRGTTVQALLTEAAAALIAQKPKARGAAKAGAK
jgi:predicted transcriptional regulator